MPRKPKSPTVVDQRDWETLCEDIDGTGGPVDPEDINIAMHVDEMIKLFGFDGGMAIDTKQDSTP
jgi:hypothetical protein